MNTSTQALYVWLSQSFPVGAFAYSHGLEWAVEAGDITDLATLTAWFADLADSGGPRMDAMGFALAHRAAAARDFKRLDDINALLVALAGSAERRLETTGQGEAFLRAIRAAWCAPGLRHFPPTATTPSPIPPPSP